MYSNIPKRRSAYWKVQNVIDCWLLSLKLTSLVNNNLEVKEWFNNPSDISFGDNKAVFTTGQLNNADNIILISENLNRTTLGTCFITMDEALKGLFGKPPEKATNDLDSLRIIIYMMRCCFAHNPTEPKWEIHSIYRKVFKIEEIDFILDLSNLDGIPVKFEHHHGSSGLMNLVGYCLKILKDKEGLIP
jgi:hypothetical protein